MLDAAVGAASSRLRIPAHLPPPPKVRGIVAGQAGVVSKPEKLPAVERLDAIVALFGRRHGGTRAVWHGADRRPPETDLRGAARP